MKKLKTILPVLLISTSFVLMYSCSYDGDNIQKETKVSVENNATLLDQRVDLTQVPIDLIPMANARLASSVSLQQTAEILPPVIEGKTVVATSLDLRNKYLCVGYSSFGADFGGGVDIIEREGDDLTILSQINMPTSDVVMTNYVNNYIYVTGGDPTSDQVAFVDAIYAKDGIADAEKHKRVRLGGHMATGIIKYGSRLLATSGDDTTNGGGFHVLNSQNNADWSVQQYVPLNDARWVDGNNEYAFVLSANPGQVHVYEKVNMEHQYSFDVSGLNHMGTKATLDVYKDFVYVSAGFEGMNVYNYRTGEFVRNIPLPDAHHSDELFCNSVTVEGKKAFMACGESVFMIQLSNVNSAPEGELVGRLELGDYQSINYVRFRSSYLAVASGLGGTKLIKVN